MLEKIATVLQDECQVVRDRPLLAAVSGGADSLALLDALWRLGYRLAVAHLDHQLRPESSEQAGELARRVREIGIPFYMKRADVAGFAQSQGLSLEEAGRILRYQFLFSQAAELNSQAVLTGHTADDQVETVLMHLLRGSGLPGLCGMAFRSLPNPWSPETALVRPLLSTWRSVVNAYLEQRGLQPIEDL